MGGGEHKCNKPINIENNSFPILLLITEYRKDVVLKVL